MALLLPGCCHNQNPKQTVVYVDRVVHDSIVQEVIKADTVIKYIKEEYDKDYSVILNQSVDDDYVFFTDYINNYGK